MLKPWYWSYDKNSQEAFDPKLRKATTLMKMLNQGLAPLLGKSQQKIPKKPVQVFFASLHGEIEPTLGFLKSLAERDWARPFLFQNSLHHSTTGFASQQFELLGPCFSICAIEDAQSEVLRAGLMQILVDPRATLLIHGESFPEELAEISRFKKQNTCELLYIDEKSAEKLARQPEVIRGLITMGHLHSVYDFLNQNEGVMIEAPS